MKKYLVMKCRELDDQYECDVERFPICITDNWKAFNGMFPMEVYEIEENGNIGKRIRNWDDPANAEKGMVLGYWSENTGEFVIEKKFVNRKPADGIPAEVKEYLQSLGDYYDDDWENNHFICAYDCYNNEYVYGEFKGDDYPTTC